MRKLLTAAVAVVGLVGFAGCKSSTRDVENQRADLARTEAKANQDISAIRAEAEKDKAEVAAEANEEMSSERQEVAQETADREREAQKDIADEREEVAEKREDLAETESELARDSDGKDGYVVSDRGDRDAPVSASATVTGTLASSFGKQITIRDMNGGEYQLGVDDATQVTHNGQRVDVDDFKEGSEVRASYTLEGDEKVAREVTITNAVQK